MRSGRVLAAVAGLVGIFGVTAAFAATAVTVGWGTAITVPGIAAFSKPANASANLNTVSCAGIRSCAAGGYYTDRAHKVQAFVAAENNGVWGKAIRVPGTGGLNLGGDAVVTPVSCGSAGNCAAGGFYYDGSLHRHTFVVEEKNGAWGSAIEVPGTAALNTGGDGPAVDALSCPSAGNCVATGGLFLAEEKNGVWGSAFDLPGGAALHSIFFGGRAVSCPSAGNCAVGGSYLDGSGGGARPGQFVVEEKNGIWGNAIELPGIATLDVDRGALMSSLSCGAVGDCAAGGYYLDGSGGAQAWVASEKNGVWGNAIEVPGTAALKASLLQVSSVSCPAVGTCVAGGGYLSSTRKYRGFVVNEKNGVWKQAIKLTGSRAFNHSSDWVNSISCATARSCAAGGPGFVVNKTSGVWRKAIKVPLEVDSISCAKAGWCAAGGREDGKALVVTEKNGIWRKAMEVPGSAALNVGGSAQVSSVSCSAAGSCAAGGYYNDGSHDQAFVVTETNGVWSDAAEVPGSADLNLGGDARVAAVSCATANSCVAGGFYTDGSDFRQAFVTSP